MQRNAVDGYLKLVRLPIDAAVRFGLGNSETVDRADAGIRALAGRIIGDQELIRDAERRRAAVDERERAALLRVEAEQRRQQATKTAEQGRQQVREDEQRAKQEAAEAERRRKAAAR